MEKKFNIKDFLKNRPLSPSAVASFEWDPEQWYESYILGKRQSSKQLEFGSMIDKKIQEDPTFLPLLPRYEFMQYELKGEVKGIPLVGKFDGLNLKEKKQLADYKTGVKKWNVKRIKDSTQIKFYLFLLYINHGIKPEDIECIIHWLPTQGDDNGDISLIGDEIKTFKCRHTFADILRFGYEYIPKVIEAMESYVLAINCGKLKERSNIKRVKEKQMALKNVERQDGKFVSILADGKMHLNVPEGTPGAIKREYETSDGKKGTKNELVFTELSGLIKKINFWDGDYGKLLQVTVEDGEEEPVVLSVSTESNFGEDLMKKLPNVNLEKPVTIVPFAFEDDKGKKKRGITVYQDDEKIESFYYDREDKKNIHGFPTPDVPAKMKKSVHSKFWKAYFTEAREFLIEDITKRLKIEDSVEDDDLKKLASGK
jgi:hypothetical protein